MAAHAIETAERNQQLALNRTWRRAPARADSVRARAARPLCAGCREREARYGFREAEDAARDERPQTLCFECFRVEIGRRNAVAARLARGWNAHQVALPIEHTLASLDRRRRHAQIAARHLLDAAE